MVSFPMLKFATMIICSGVWKKWAEKAAFDHPKTASKVSKTQAEAKLEMEDEVRIEEGPLGLRTH